MRYPKHKIMFFVLMIISNLRLLYMEKNAHAFFLYLAYYCIAYVGLLNIFKRSKIKFIFRYFDNILANFIVIGSAIFLMSQSYYFLSNIIAALVIVYGDFYDEVKTSAHDMDNLS